MIAGIVLAGGRSQRMGRPKALLTAHGKSFLERCVDSLQGGGCEDILVVLNSEDSELARLTSAAGARIVRGAGEGSEQIDSLRAGLRDLTPGVEAVVVLPVDHPLVGADTVAALVRVYLESRAPIVRAAHRGKHGHPVLFDRVCFSDLLEGKAAEGARSVIRQYRDVLRDVEVSDQGVLADIDTPADFEKYFGEKP
jgi:molybdenum cofactor cytidylyltransferase